MVEDFSQGLSPFSFGIILLALGILGVTLWGFYRWSRLKPELFPNSEQPDYTSGEASAIDKEAGMAQLLDRLPMILTGARRALEKGHSIEDRLPAAIMRKLETETAGFVSVIKDVLARSLESAEMHSVLMRQANLFVYIVAIPGRHEHPHLIRRYPAFSEGWGAHANLLRAGLTRGSEFHSLISFLFFLNPDGRGGALYVSYEDAEITLLPSGLIRETERKNQNAKTLDSRYEFSLSH
jgi:hypothetical protein